jgi:hypothetical protein
MIESGKSDYVNYRFNRANETFEEALILAENNRWNAIVNRLYYASFYAVTALLIKYGIETKSHDRVRIKFSQEFVSKGLIGKEMGRLFTKLSDFRTKGDYGDLFDYDKVIVEPLIAKTRGFINKIGEVLQSTIR